MNWQSLKFYKIPSWLCHFLISCGHPTPYPHHFSENNMDITDWVQCNMLIFRWWQTIPQWAVLLWGSRLGSFEYNLHLLYGGRNFGRYPDEASWMWEPVTSTQTRLWQLRLAGSPGQLSQGRAHTGTCFQAGHGCASSFCCEDPLLSPRWTFPFYYAAWLWESHMTSLSHSSAIYALRFWGPWLLRLLLSLLLWGFSQGHEATRSLLRLWPCFCVLSAEAPSLLKETLKS